MYSIKLYILYFADILEQRIKINNYLENEQIMQEIKVPASTEEILCEEPQSEISNPGVTDLAILNSEGSSFLLDVSQLKNIILTKNLKTF